MAHKPRNLLESARHALDWLLDRETGQYDPTNIDLDRLFRKLSGVSGVAVSIVSGGGMAFLSYAYISDLKVPVWFNYAISAAIVYSMYLITDKYLKKAVTIWMVWLCLCFYKDVWLDVREALKKHGEPKYALASRFFSFCIWAGIGAAIFVICYVDYVAVDSIREPVADVIPKDSTRSLAAERSAIYAQTNPGINRVNEQIKAAQSRYDNAESYVRKLKSNRVYLRLIEKGEAISFANSKLNAQAAEIKNKAKKEIDRLNDIQDGLIRDQTAAVVQLSKEIGEFNKDVQGRNIRIGIKAGFLILAGGFILKLFHILINMLRPLYFFAMRRRRKDQDVNNDGVVDENDVDAYYQRLAREANEKGLRRSAQGGF